MLFSPRKTVYSNPRCSKVAKAMEQLRLAMTPPFMDELREKQLHNAILQEDTDLILKILSRQPQLASRELWGSGTAIEQLLKFRDPPSLEVVQAVGELMNNSPLKANIGNPKYLRIACESEHGSAPGVITYLSQKFRARTVDHGPPYYYFRRSDHHWSVREPLHVYLTRKRTKLPRQRRFDLHVVQELLDAFPNCLDGTSMSIAFLNRHCPLWITELMVDRCIQKGNDVVLEVHKSCGSLPMDSARVKLLLRLAAHNSVTCASHMFTKQTWLYFLACLEDGAKVKALELKLHEFQEEEQTRTTWSTLLRILQNNVVGLTNLEFREPTLILDCRDLFHALRGNSTLKELYLFTFMSSRERRALHKTLRNHNFTLSKVTTRNGTERYRFLKLNKHGRGKLIQNGATKKDLVYFLSRVPSAAWRNGTPPERRSSWDANHLVHGWTDTQYGLLREVPELWAH